MTRGELTFEIDSIRGNINRMCVTYDMEECETMFNYAKARLKKIHNHNINRILTVSTHETDLTP